MGFLIPDAQLGPNQSGEKIFVVIKKGNSDTLVFMKEIDYIHYIFLKNSLKVCANAFMLYMGLTAYFALIGYGVSVTIF
jgi:hypothetical protein